MKYLIGLLIFISLNAGLLDFKYIKEAQEAYKKGDYNRSIELYSKVKQNDEIKLNLANSYYKLAKYKDATSLYEQIVDKKLQFEKFANLGNALAKQKKIDDAIKAYEKALKIKQDRDVKFNLELLKKLKQQQKKKNKQNKKNNKHNQKKNNKQNQQNQNNKNKNNQNNKQNRSQKQNKQDNKKKQEKNRQKEQNKAKNNKEKDKNKEQKAQNKKANKENKKKKQKQNGLKKAQMKKVPISDMELRKYNKMLDKRGIKTLLLPINSKGAKKDEKNINPW